MKPLAFVPFLAFFALSFSGCGSLLPAIAGGSGSNPSGAAFAVENGGEPFWTTLPSPEGLVFIGGAGIRSKIEESVQFALEDAARKVSLFKGVEGSFVTRIDVGAGALDYQNDTRGSLDFSQDYKGYVDSFDFNKEKDVLRTETSLFVRVRYPGSVSITYPIPPRKGNEKPLWVDDPPVEIPGYEVGLGYAGRRSTHKDTVSASCENAIFTIIRNIAVSTKSKDQQYEGSGLFDHSASTKNEINAQGSLLNFYVLDTWIDPATKAVWTLAVAQKK